MNYDNANMELVASWWRAADNLTYKLLKIDRSEIDEDSAEGPAYNLVGIDSGNVRRVDISLDDAYGRDEYIDRELIEELSDCAPTDAKDILGRYFA